MIRFIVLFALFVIGWGFFLQMNMHVPYLQWIGHLPGDLLILKNGVTIYLPLTTSLIFSVALSLLFSKASHHPSDH